MGYTKYSRDRLVEIVASSQTMSEVLLRLGLRLSGGSHAHIKRRLRQHGIDTGHFVGSRANRGSQHVGGPAKIPWQEVLVLRAPNAPRVHSQRMRRALRESGRRYCCEVCGQEPTWNGTTLVLQVDHINGLPQDSRPENLRFICPNCHSQTVNFGVRNHAHAELARYPTDATAPHSAKRSG
jgi:hypothetical protein